MHEHLVNRQAMQPGGESRVAAETADLAKQMDEHLLREVLPRRDVLGPAQTQAVDALNLALIEPFKGIHVASDCSLHQHVIRS